MAASASIISSKSAFIKTILPFIDPDLRKKVQSIQWLQPTEVQ